MASVVVGFRVIVFKVVAFGVIAFLSVYCPHCSQPSSGSPSTAITCPPPEAVPLAHGIVIDAITSLEAIQIECAYLVTSQGKLAARRFGKFIYQYRRSDRRVSLREFCSLFLASLCRVSGGRSLNTSWSWCPIKRRPALVFGKRKSFQLFDLIPVIYVDLEDNTKTQMIFSRDEEAIDD